MVVVVVLEVVVIRPPGASISTSSSEMSMSLAAKPCSRVSNVRKSAAALTNGSHGL